MEESCHPNTIPANCIGLKDAFYQFLKARRPDLDIDSSGRFNSYPEEDQFKTLQEQYDADKKARDAIGEVELEFRAALQSGHIFALTGTAEVPNRIIGSEEWRLDVSNCFQGFWSNYLDGTESRFDLNPGPDTRMGSNNRRAPIFFERKHFKDWLEHQYPAGSVEGLLPSAEDERRIFIEISIDGAPPSQQSFVDEMMKRGQKRELARARYNELMRQGGHLPASRGRPKKAKQGVI